MIIKTFEVFPKDESIEVLKDKLVESLTYLASQRHEKSFTVEFSDHDSLIVKMLDLNGNLN
jgi:hypothetical protein